MMGLSWGTFVVPALFGTVAATALFATPQPVLAKACGPAVYEKLRSPPSGKDDRVRITCDVVLSANDVIARKLVFGGENASGVTFDCRGATIGTPATKSTFRSPTVSIHSQRARGDDEWSVPRNVTIRNCRIVGSLRMTGLGPNGEAEAVRRSSLTRTHTRNAQRNAPSDVVLSNLTFEATGGIPLYFGPGVTNSSVTDSVFKGRTDKTAIYLDAESAGNVIRDNRFLIDADREMIAVDGSARNIIAGNLFDAPDKGGIFVYRNCGEGGTIRHQKPQFNEIVGNRFVYRTAGLARPAIWLNHRDIGKWFCKTNPKYPFGSSLDPRDLAKHNIVRDNRFDGPWSLRIVNFDDTNTITGNR